MKTPVNRQTVNLTKYPKLVVIYLGMRVRTIPGIKTLLGMGPRIDKAGEEWPDGLLHYENNIIFNLFPLHIGMRWYWKDFESMEQWTRSSVHREWWKKFTRNPDGTGFWHETYFMQGKMEGIFIDIEKPLGFLNFGDVVPARGSRFAARQRLGREGPVPEQPEGMTEGEVY